MAGFLSLETGRRALQAQRIGLDVTSNNIANVNTPNYTRQRANFVETTPTPTSAGLKGTGVQVNYIDRFRAEFVERAIRDNISRAEAYRVDRDILARAEALLNEPSEFGIGNSLTDFFAAVEDLQLRPESVDKRQILLDTADEMTRRFRLTAERFDELRDDIRQSFETNVRQMNNILRDIAKVNEEIVAVQAKRGNESAAYGDRRQQLLESLSELTNIQVKYADDNQVYVSINGQAVVSGPHAVQFRPVEEMNPDTGERTIRMFQLDANNNITEALEPRAGQLASLMRHYNVVLDPVETSGAFSVYKNLNDIAATIVEKVNEISRRGYGLDDPEGEPPGRNFFDPAPAGKPVLARNIKISDDILNSPRSIPAASRPNEPGNNEIIREIASLANKQDFINGSKYSEFYAQTLVGLGSIGREALNGQMLTGLITDQLRQQREEIAGVSLDEEAVNLIKFQRAFEAAARIVNVSDEFLQTIIRLGS